MESLNNLFHGFAVALQPINILYGFIGVFIGNLIGVLPGLGPSVALALLLPVTYSLEPTGAFIMLAGIYYGSMYGGTITSILLKIPGDAPTILATLDGHEMAKKGRPGQALVLQAIASFIGGIIAVILVIFIAKPAAAFGLNFGPPEFTLLMLLCFLLVSAISGKSLTKGIIMTFFGLVLSLIGMDVVTGDRRLTFGALFLDDGLHLLPLILGLFALSEIFVNIEENKTGGMIDFKPGFKNMLPSKEEYKRSVGPVGRGSIIGFFMGLLPGGGALLSAFASYGIEKKLSKNPGNFGKGEIEGLVGPEAANNAGSTSAFIPLLTLGLPTNAVTAILLGALIIHGITPGPLLVQTEPALFWGVLASMFIGNIILVILNIPIISLWLNILRVPASILYPLIFVLCVVGSYIGNYTVIDVIVMYLFGLIGYFLKKYQFEFGPLVLAFVLGPIIDESLRQSLIISRGSFSIFVNRQMSLVLVVVMAAVILWLLLSTLIKFLKNKKSSIASEDPTLTD